MKTRGRRVKQTEMTGWQSGENIAQSEMQGRLKGGQASSLRN